jgi:hypothetical protein
VHGNGLRLDCLLKPSECGVSIHQQDHTPEADAPILR